MRPFASIVCNDGRYRLHAQGLGAPSYQTGAVNAACELAGLVARQYVWGRQDRIALHAAAIAINGSLIVFPAQRRAGKTMLTIAAALLGARVFSDDVLPIEFAPGDPMLGVALGVAPRARLPIPAMFTSASSSLQLPFVENHQYRYIAVPGLANAGEKLPIGAFVAIAREDNDPVTIKEVSRGTMLGTLLTQNFGRGPHAEVLLDGLHRLASAAPSFSLTYSDPMEAAARLLSDLPSGLCTSAPLAPSDRPIHTAKVTGEPTSSVPTVWRRANANLVEIDGYYYAAHASGDRILHLNDGMVRIWNMLTEPTSLCAAVSLMKSAFSDVNIEALETDLATGFDALAKAGLISAT